jgi:excisionase family DNA binding protein
MIEKEHKKDRRWMDTEEVAVFIGRSPGAIRNLVMRHRIPFRKIGGRLNFIRTEIQAWMEAVQIEVEQDVSIPKDRYFRKYPLPEMEVGDSFFVPFMGHDALRIQSRVKSCAQQFAKLHDNKKHFTIRILRHQHGVRCWRTR